MINQKSLHDILTYLEKYQCRLVAVGKTKPASAIQEAFDQGVVDFGENKVQELTDKEEILPKSIQWHMIGHLQRNKVKYIAPFIHLIHSVDSPRLLREVNKQGKKIDRVIPCLLQMHIAKEESKYGFDQKQLDDLLRAEGWKEWQHVRLIGLMGMATYTQEEHIIRNEFRFLKSLYDELKSNPPHNQFQFSELSMGMTNDYRIAVEEGSTMVRIGSAIFGERK